MTADGDSHENTAAEELPAASSTTVERAAWQAQLDALGVRGQAHTRRVNVLPGVAGR